jgi:hypothetical protein
MTAIERYEPPTATVAHYDSWVPVLAPVIELAQAICNTDFVPESFRGNATATAAAILTGRELGIGPMASLRHIHVVKGKPGQSAELMRSFVFAAGHQIRYPEMTDSRCVVEGRRKNEQEWTRISFTADQARRAKIDLSSYPEDKLVARATSRLCRRLFADCIGGLPTVDELEDFEDGVIDTPAGDTESQQPARRTARRRTTVTAPAPAAATNGEAPAPAEPAGPPLPGEDGYDTAPNKASAEQLGMLRAKFTELDVEDRDRRLAVVCKILDRPVESSTDLTAVEAGVVIDTLSHLAANEDGPLLLADLMREDGEPDAEA